MSFEEKAESVDVDTGKYVWSQTIDEVHVTIMLPKGTTGKQLEVKITNTELIVKLKSESECRVKGEFAGQVKKGDCLWTLEDNEKLVINLSKGKHHESWPSLLKGEHVLDPFMKEKMDKKMMLEKFQKENPGFDFSGAEFTGQIPKDPTNFMKFD
eukprot:TRINITY_DN25704_c0_g1_i1.p1 TRINITY_DN25704_c0_g1~~TRINITY_DN25704_c0_g1_i1.p1  ORF type:complete len:155 (-),score=45.70 TRINITY_DN25704_c0_g1_i1:137-601(-)